MKVKLIKPGYGRVKGAPMDVTPDKAFVMMVTGFVEKDHRWMAEQERKNPRLAAARRRLDPAPKRWVEPVEPPKPEPEKKPEPAAEPEPEEKPKPKKKRRGRPRKKKITAAEPETEGKDDEKD